MGQLRVLILKRLIQIGAGLLLPLMVYGQGRAELNQSMMPITISQSGSYILTENLSLDGSEIALIARGSIWRYLDTGVDQGTAWRATSFDDSGWSQGPARLGYGNDGEVTTVSFGPDSNDKYVTTYFRHAFQVNGAGTIGDLDLFVTYDDGFVAYLNGVEVVRSPNMPGGVITFSTRPTSFVANADETTFFEFDIDHTLLVNGTNILAVEVHQFDEDSSDLGLDVELVSDIPPTNGITITTNHVSLNLNGFTLEGSGSPLTTGDGIKILSGVQNVSVYNGSVVNWGEDGIDAGNIVGSAAEGCHFYDLKVSGNYIEGLVGGIGGLVQRCFSTINGRINRDPENGEGTGFIMGEASLVEHCFSIENWGHGILSRKSSATLESIVYQTDHDGIKHDITGLAWRNIVVGQRRNGDGFEIDGNGAFIENTSYRNADDALKARDNGFSLFVRNIGGGTVKSDGINTGGGKVGSMVVGNTTVDNGDDGIVVGGRSLVVDNNSHLNGFRSGGTPGGGVRVEQKNEGDESLCRVEDNHVHGNEKGIEADGSNNLIIKNSARNNTLADYDSDIGNDITGALSTNPSTAGPWDNFE